MNNKWPVQLKAAFFLLVFVLNTIAVTACAIGMDKSATPDRQAIVQTHSHGHHPASDKNDCCSGRMAEITKADKAIPQTIQPAGPVFLTAALYCNTVVPLSTQTSTVNNYYLNRYYPPIPDILIAIRSFRI